MAGVRICWVRGTEKIIETVSTASRFCHNTVAIKVWKFLVSCLAGRRGQGDALIYPLRDTRCLWMTGGDGLPQCLSLTGL